MTELIADKIRLIYAEIAQLGTRRIETLANRLAYLPQILIIEAVFNTINPNDYNEGFNLFAKAFITGDKKIYKIISDKFKEQGIKDGLKILMSMGTTLTDALQTAQQLGLIDATQKIEALVKEAEQTSN